MLSAVKSDHSLDPVLDSLSAERLLNHIKVLSSDAFEGRSPATAGETKSVEYLTRQFQTMGLKPGNPDGSYVQDVPLEGFQVTNVVGSFDVGGKKLALRFPEDWVVVSRRPSRKVAIADSDVVFVGYGVVAPEYAWDDYKGVDVRGKTIVMLVNDPPVPDSKDPARLDASMFRGRAMTYYGRWTYKYEIASEKGADAVILIHETEPAGYPYSVVQGSWGRENFDIATRGQAISRVAMEGWITHEKALELFRAAGLDLASLKKAAIRKDFHPVTLDAQANFALSSSRRSVTSKNVVARLDGSDPKLKDQNIIYTAHWDHLGRDESLKGDQIFNGAADNASGTAALLELANAFMKLNPAPKRSIVFLAVTAEEKGLLGAKYYATHPLYPLEKTLVNLNMDVINLWGKTRDVVNLGLGQTSLDELIDAAAREQGRHVVGDPEPEKGHFFRSDHFEFCKEGVPAVSARGGVDYLGKPSDYGLRKRIEYTTNDYHKVSDEVKPGWEMSGAIEDLRLLATVGFLVAQGEKFPEWRPGSEFREKRRKLTHAIPEK
ncbi:MAG: M28 family metallopeptidase [Isosphaeraceae bacterium]